MRCLLLQYVGVNESSPPDSVSDGISDPFGSLCEGSGLNAFLAVARRKSARYPKGVVFSRFRQKSPALGLRLGVCKEKPLRCMA